MTGANVSSAATTSRRYLRRYRRARPIRSRGAFELISAVRDADGAPCVVLVPGPSSERQATARAFAAIERAHELIDHPRSPPVTARGAVDGVPYLELGCDAVMDGVDVFRLFAESPTKMSLQSADGFVTELRQALRKAHSSNELSSDNPLCLGRLSYANLLFASTGLWYLVGFGHNFPIEKADGQTDAWLTIFQAPEMAMSEQASPSGDHVALSLCLRTLLRWVDVGPVISRVVRGDVRKEDGELLECIQRFEHSFLGAPARLRCSVAEAEAITARARVLCGIEPNPSGFRAFVRQIVEHASRSRSENGLSSARSGLVLGLEASWVAGQDGVRHSLNPAHRRIIAALADIHERAPGAALTVREILEAGWPGERVLPEAGANRVIRRAHAPAADGYARADRALYRGLPLRARSEDPDRLVNW